MIFICIWLLIIFCSCIESFIISPSPGPGNVRAEFLAYVIEFLTRGPGMYIIYMIGDEDCYDDDDDEYYVMIILPNPLLGKLGTLCVKDMHDFHLKGHMCSDILFRLTMLVSFHLYLMLYILSTLSLLTPLSLRGLRFMPAGVDAQFGDPPA